MKSFGSDNHSGVSPEIIEAIASVNSNHYEAYGDDIYTQRAEELLNETFGSVKSYFVFNGTGANIFALKCITQGYNSIICAETAHINVDECGAPENFTLSKLVTVPTCDGKLTPELVKPYLKGFNERHHSQPKVISISQPTELGTLYSVAEIDALGALAHEYGMKLHIDGARLSNAVAAIGCDPKEMLKSADVVSFGGTKNGLMVGEAVLFFNQEDTVGAMFHQKRAMQLYSKSRFMAAQFLAYIKDGIWLKNASNANRMASYLSERLAEVPEVTIAQSVDTNGLFVNMAQEYIDKLLESYTFYIWNESIPQIRLMVSYDIVKEDVDKFIDDLKAVIKG